jgi:hypothetical protein
VKYLTSLKLPLLLVVAGVVLLFAPSCKAQSEVSPDHFDGTDSWAAAAQTQHSPKLKQASANSKVQPQTRKNSQSSSLQLAASREVVKPAPKQAAVVDRKPKSTARPPERK